MKKRLSKKRILAATVTLVVAVVLWVNLTSGRRVEVIADGQDWVVEAVPEQNNTSVVQIRQAANGQVVFTSTVQFSTLQTWYLDVDPPRVWLWSTDCGLFVYSHSETAGWQETSVSYKDEQKLQVPKRVAERIPRVKMLPDD